ncbi:uncharacterized protein [Panulirus ornatus]|uniref:uncharacterized protein n=1 Tax=Panulirus ornatus TaxID=150431 RepID=UPI003A854A70
MWVSTTTTQGYLVMCSFIFLASGQSLFDEVDMTLGIGDTSPSTPHSTQGSSLFGGPKMSLSMKELQRDGIQKDVLSSPSFPVSGFYNVKKPKSRVASATVSTGGTSQRQSGSLFDEIPNAGATFHNFGASRAVNRQVTPRLKSRAPDRHSSLFDLSDFIVPSDMDDGDNPDYFDNPEQDVKSQRPPKHNTHRFQLPSKRNSSSKGEPDSAITSQALQLLVRYAQHLATTFNDSTPPPDATSSTFPHAVQGDFQLAMETSTISDNPRDKSSHGDELVEFYSLFHEDDLSELSKSLGTSDESKGVSFGKDLDGEAIAELRRRRLEDLRFAMEIIKSFESPLLRDDKTSEEFELKLAKSIFNQQIKSLSELNRKQRDTLQSLMTMVKNPRFRQPNSYLVAPVRDPRPAVPSLATNYRPTAAERAQSNFPVAVRQQQLPAPSPAVVPFSNYLAPSQQREPPAPPPAVVPSSNYLVPNQQREPPAPPPAVIPSSSYLVPSQQREPPAPPPAVIPSSSYLAPSQQREPPAPPPAVIPSSNYLVPNQQREPQAPPPAVVPPSNHPVSSQQRQPPAPPPAVVPPSNYLVPSQNTPVAVQQRDPPAPPVRDPSNRYLVPDRNQSPTQPTSARDPEPNLPSSVTITPAQIYLFTNRGLTSGASSDQRQQAPAANLATGYSPPSRDPTPAPPKPPSVLYVAVPAALPSQANPQPLPPAPPTTAIPTTRRPSATYLPPTAEQEEPVSSYYRPPSGFLPLETTGSRDDTDEWKPIIPTSDQASSTGYPQSTPADQLPSGTRNDTKGDVYYYHYHYHFEGDRGQFIDTRDKESSDTGTYSYISGSCKSGNDCNDPTLTDSSEASHDSSRQKNRNHISRNPSKTRPSSFSSRELKDPSDPSISSYSSLSQDVPEDAPRNEFRYGAPPTPANPPSPTYGYGLPPTPPPANPPSPANGYGPPPPTTPAPANPPSPANGYGPPPPTTPAPANPPRPMYGYGLPPTPPPANPQTPMYGYGPPPTPPPANPPTSMYGYGPSTTPPPANPPAPMYGYGPPPTPPPANPPSPVYGYGPPPTPPANPPSPMYGYGPPRTLPPANPPTPMYGYGPPPTPLNPPSSMYGYRPPPTPSDPPRPMYGSRAPAPPPPAPPAPPPSTSSPPQTPNRYPRSPLPGSYGLPQTTSTPAAPTASPPSTYGAPPQRDPRPPAPPPPSIRTKPKVIMVEARPPPPPRNPFSLHKKSKPPKFFQRAPVVALGPVPIGQRVYAAPSPSSSQRDTVQRQRDALEMQRDELQLQYLRNQQEIQQQEKEIRDLNQLQLQIQVQEMQREKLKKDLFLDLKKEDKFGDFKKLFYEGAMLLGIPEK